MYIYIYIHINGRAPSSPICHVCGSLDMLKIVFSLWYLSMVICLDNLNFDGQYNIAHFFLRPFKLKYTMYSSLVPLSWNC